jgi:phenylacetate-CoA ligase
MADHLATLDQLETRAPEQRERDLLARRRNWWHAPRPPRLGAHTGARQPGRHHQPRGAGHPAGDAQIRAARPAAAERPVWRPEYTPVGQLSRVFMSPGPIFDPEGRGADWWRFARPLYAAGVRAGGLLQNCFAYHFTPAAFMVEGGAAKSAAP